jgi:hypothetical protein
MGGDLQAARASGRPRLARVSFVRDESTRPDPAEASSRQIIKWQRAAWSDRIADATLACPRCDAPVEIGPGRRSIAAPLACPYCAHAGPARDFLSLAAPTRPAHVVVRVGLPAAS